MVEWLKNNYSSLNEKIYTENDFKKVIELISSEERGNNTLCGRRSCKDILPNHFHSKKVKNEKKLSTINLLKTLFFWDKWDEINMNENPFEKKITQDISSIVDDESKGVEKNWEICLTFLPYVKSIEEYLSRSPKLELIEKEWKNKEVREKWLKENEAWEDYQEAITATKKQNLFSSPATWISIAIVLSLAAIGWVFYRRRKTTKKQKN